MSSPDWSIFLGVLEWIGFALAALVLIALVALAGYFIAVAAIGFIKGMRGGSS